MSDCPEPSFGRWKVSWGREVSNISVLRVMPIAEILRVMSERLKMKSLISPRLSAVDHVISVVTVLKCRILSISSFSKCWFSTKSTFDGFQGCRLLRLIWGLFLGWSVCIKVKSRFFSLEGHGKTPLYDMTLRRRFYVGSSWTFKP